MKLLIIEDHPKIRENLIEFFEIKGHTAEGAIHGEDAMSLLHGNYDVIVLDMNMPIMDGKTFIQTIRDRSFETPVLVLTSNSLIDDKITMFDLGADDYVTKPFDMREVEARVIALFKRKRRMLEEVIHFDKYTLEVGKKVLKKGNVIVELSNKEYGIMEYLARNKGYPKSKADILEAVWGMREAELAMDSITLEAHISTIRKKLGKHVIETMKGVGYLVQ